MTTSLDESPVCGSSSFSGTNGVCKGRSMVPSLKIRISVPISLIRAMREELQGFFVLDI